MRYVAFLRAINVGGHVVKMNQLQWLFTAMDFQDVATFIASGNVIFTTSRRASAAEALIEKNLHANLGYAVSTMVRTPAELEHILAAAKHSSVRGKPEGYLYVGLLKRAPTASAAKAVSNLSNEIDQLSIDGRELYWRCGTSFSQSTITGSRLEKLLGVPATLRNVSTIARIVARYAQS